MSSEMQRIYNQLQQAFDGEPWHGSSMMLLLTGIRAAKALAKPVSQVHSIWELILHITAWRNFAIAKLSGQVSFDISTAEQDWPAIIHTDEQAWQKALQDLQTSQQRLLELMKEVKDVLLEEIVPGRKYTFYVLLHGIIQHDLYHCGQIALLKKHF